MYNARPLERIVKRALAREIPKADVARGVRRQFARDMSRGLVVSITSADL